MRASISRATRTSMAWLWVTPGRWAAVRLWSHAHSIVGRCRRHLWTKRQCSLLRPTVRSIWSSRPPGVAIPIINWAVPLTTAGQCWVKVRGSNTPARFFRRL